MSDQLHCEDQQISAQEFHDLGDTQLEDVAGANGAYNPATPMARVAGVQSAFGTFQQTGSVKQAAAAGYLADKQTRMAMSMNMGSGQQVM